MPQTITIQLEKPIASAKLLDGDSRDPATISAEAKQAQQLKQQQESLLQACHALQDAVNKVNKFQDNLIMEHKDQIAKLSVEIARKILVQKVQEKDYEIESIVKEALKNAPMHQDVVVYLNPEDLVQVQKLQQEDACGILADLKFVSDPNIGRAECLLKTPKGIIESVIDKHLEQIGQALKKAE